MLDVATSPSLSAVFKTTKPKNITLRTGWSCCRYRYDDLGGISGILQEVRELIEYPLVHPEVYAHLGIEPVRMMRCSRGVMQCDGVCVHVENEATSMNLYFPSAVSCLIGS